MSIEQKTFKGNIAVSISDNEVRLWVCNEEGMNIYRFKALGRVYNAADGQIVIGRKLIDPNEEKYWTHEEGTGSFFNVEMYRKDMGIE